MSTFPPAEHVTPLYVGVRVDNRFHVLYARYDDTVSATDDNAIVVTSEVFERLEAGARDMSIANKYDYQIDELKKTTATKHFTPIKNPRFFAICRCFRPVLV